MIEILNISSNGKLYIIGEYNVLRPKGKAILLGINKHIDFQIQESQTFSYLDNGDKEIFYLQDGEVVFTNGNDPLVKIAISESFKYLNYLNVELKTFALEIKSHLANDGIKLGLGSSAAIITGTIKSILAFHEIAFDELLIFKLAVITKIKAEEYSSGGDLASSLYQGLILYRRYNLKWVLKNINSKKIYESSWPDLKIVPISSQYKFGAVWTKESYKTVPLTYEITKKEYRDAQKLVNKAYRSLCDNHWYDLKVSLNQYQLWLEKVLKQDELVTPKLSKGIEIANDNYLTAKISGAGGGDSIIFLLPKGYYLNNFEKDLEKNNLELLEV